MPFPLFALGSAAIAALTMVAATRLARRQWTPIIVTVAGALALLLFNGISYQNFVFDDAFITLRYSQHLADGLGPNWNSSGRVEGYTSFLWMALLAGVARLGFDLVVSVRVLGLLAVAATWIPVYKLWRLWGRETEGSGIDSPVVFAAVVVGLVLTGGVGLAASGGLETPLFMALITAGGYLFLNERRSGGLPWSAAAFAAAAMTRPEGLIAVGVTGLFVLFDAAALPDRRQAIARAATWGGVFLAIYGSYFLWRYTYYDYLLPNTYYAKVGANLAIFNSGLGYLYESGLKYYVLYMLLGTAGLLTQPKLRGDGAYILAIVGAMLAGVVYEGGDFMAHGRFVGPLMPLLYIGGIAGFAILLKRSVPHPGYAALVAFVALSLSGMALVQTSNDGAAVSFSRTGRQQAEQFARWLDAHTPSDFTIAGVAVGVLGYYSNRDVLDVVGINDVVIAHTSIPNLGDGKPGHEKHNTDYVFAQRPEIVPFALRRSNPLSREESGVEVLGIEGWDAIFRDSRLNENYELRYLFLGNRWYSFFQRADTVDLINAPGIVGDQSRLGSDVGPSDGEWSGWRSTVSSSGDEIVVSSERITYGAVLNVPSIQPEQGQTYVALAWVKGNADGIDDHIEIVVREDGLREGESLRSVPLSDEWKPVWVTHTVSRSNVNTLSVHVVRQGEVARPGAFMFKDPHLLISQ